MTNNIYNLLPRESSFTVSFVDGKKRTLILRPFTLRDEAYLQQEFANSDILDKLTSLDVNFACKMVWRQLVPESKELFDDVVAIDDDGKVIKDAEGYEKFASAFGGVEQLAAAYNALLECRGMNSILDDSSKKKR